MPSKVCFKSFYEKVSETLIGNNVGKVYDYFCETVFKMQLQGMSQGMKA